MSKNALYNYYFAKEIDGADIKLHEQAIIECGDPAYAIEFAENISGADINALGSVILKSGTANYIERLSEETKFHYTTDLDTKEFKREKILSLIKK